MGKSRCGSKCFLRSVLKLGASPGIFYKISFYKISKVNKNDNDIMVRTF